MYVYFRVFIENCNRKELDVELFYYINRIGKEEVFVGKYISFGREGFWSGDMRVCGLCCFGCFFV